MTLQDFINGTKEMPFWAVSLRAAILYIFLIIATRFMRQRQIGILSGHNYLVAAGIVSLAAIRMFNPESSLIAGVVVILLYATANILISYLDTKIPRHVDRHAIILVENGQLLKKNMLDARVTIENLLGQLRLKNIYSMSEISLALIEPTGKINVIKKQASLPVTRKQMKLPLKNVCVPAILISDGKMQQKNLKALGLDADWLENKIKEKGVPQAKDIYLALLEGDGTLYISVK